MAHSDTELVQSVIAGDQGALGEIYDRYADRIFSFAVSRLRDDAAAGDAMQDTFVKAAERMDTLRDPARLRPWLFSIARNAITDQARSRQRFAGDEELVTMAAELEEPEADLTRAENAALLWEAADGLADRDRDLLEMQLRHGLSNEELAESLDVTSSHLHVLQSRLRDRVAKSMGALLVARQGRDDCLDLQAVLVDWDGRFTMAVRSRVTRHVESCEVCEQNRAGLISSGGFLGVLPLAAAPPGLRTGVLEAMTAARMQMPTAQVPRIDEPAAPIVNGPPPPSPSAPRPRSSWWWAPGAAAIVALGVVAYLLLSGQDSSDTDVLAAGASTSSTSTAEATSSSIEATTSTTIAPVTTTAAPVDSSTTATTVSSTTTASTTSTSTTSTTATTEPPPPAPGQLTLGSTVLDLGLTSASAPLLLSNIGGQTVSWSASVSAPFSLSAQGGSLGPNESADLQVGIDRTGLGEGPVSAEVVVFDGTTTRTVPVSAIAATPPQLLRFRMTPSIVTVAASPSCTNTIAAATVLVMDESKIGSVVLKWTAPDGSTGEEDMVALGQGGYEMLDIGPFTAIGQVDLVVEATDEWGATATDETTLPVQPCI